MATEFRLPSINGDDREQLAQIRSYLHQFIPQLQYELNRIDGILGEVKEEETKKDSTEDKPYDYVTATGIKQMSSGFWRYKKWKRGNVDLIGEFDVAVAHAEVLGEAAISYQIGIELPFPVSSCEYTVSVSNQAYVPTYVTMIDQSTIGFRLISFITIDHTSTAKVRIIASGKHNTNI